MSDRSDRELIQNESRPFAEPEGSVQSVDSSRPYLSVVVTARNDDHGGNLIRRMQTFVNALVAQAKRHDVTIELLVVDWNPPYGKCPLIDALEWPADLGPVEVRFVEVPPSLHDRYAHGSVLPLYQMIAKNVGIRRARGRFVLATNIDVIFSHELFEFLAAEGLESGYMYRVDRYDAMQDVPVDASIDEQLEYCASNLIRINTRLGTFPVDRAGRRLIEDDDILDADGGIRLGKGWYPLEGAALERFRWVLNDAEILLDPVREAALLALEVEPGPGVDFLPFGLRVVDASGGLLQQTIVARRQRVLISVHAGPEPTLIRLRIAGGGLETARDPRILNFRVFSVAWESDADQAEAEQHASSPTIPGRRRAAPRRSRPSVVQPPPSRPVLRTLPRRAWNSLRTLRTAGGPVQMGIPLPRFVVDRLRPRLEGSDFVFTVDPNWFRLSRPRRGVPAATVQQDFVPEALDLLWGKGWYPEENYKGERFRWARNGAELILCTPKAEPAGLCLHIEPGPELGYGPFHLQVRDGSGAVVATATVTRRQWIELPLPWLSGRTQIFSFHARGEHAPRSLPNDSRSLCFRVMECCWAPKEMLASAVEAEEKNEKSAASDSPWIPIARQGVLLGYGWRSVIHEATGEPAWEGEPNAEIVVRGATHGPLVLDLVPGEDPTEPLELVVMEGSRPLATRVLRGREQIRLGLQLEEGQTTVLRLLTSKPHRTPVPPTAVRFLRLMRATWGDIGFAGAGASSSTDASRAMTPRSGPAPLGAVHLHTNACGDFTLMARDHWFDLRGYPEFDLFSMNLDSVFCYSAHHGGAPEKILPDKMRIYHIEHATGSGFTPEGQTKLFERIAAKGLGWISYEEVLDWATQMRRLERPMIFNGRDWGFETIDLPERRIESRTTAGAHTQSSHSS